MWLNNYNNNNNRKKESKRCYWHESDELSRTVLFFATTVSIQRTKGGTIAGCWEHVSVNKVSRDRFEPVQTLALKCCNAEELCTRTGRVPAQIFTIYLTFI